MVRKILANLNLGKVARAWGSVSNSVCWGNVWPDPAGTLELRGYCSNARPASRHVLNLMQ